MHSSQVTTNLIKLTRLRLMNAYLVREDDGFTLVDTTLQGAAEDLVSAAAAAGGAIRRILLTHGHGDHIGSLDALRARLGEEVEVLIPHLDAQILAGETVDAPGRKRGTWPKIQTRPDVVVQPGTRIGSLESVPAPGHTPGQLAFLDVRDRSLIAGDAFSAVGGLAVPSHPHWKFPLPWAATWNRPQALESARRLQALEPAVMVVGHGPAIVSPGDAIRRAITDAQ